MKAEAPHRPWSPRPWAAPIAAAAAVRLALLVFALARGGSAALSRPDTHSYLDPGRNLLLHGAFAVNGLPQILRTPGYPLFLALATLVGPIAASLAQILLSALSVLLVGRLAFRVFANRRVARAAAWIFAFEPLSVLYSILLLPETLFLFLFLVSLDRLAAFLRTQNLRALAFAGVSLAAATFVRPLTCYLPLALAVGLFVSLIRIPTLRWNAPAIFLLCVLPFLAAWQLRNWVQTGFAGFSAIPTHNLYFFTAADVAARIQRQPLAEVQNQLGYGTDQQFRERHPEATAWSQSQRLNSMRAESLRILRAHPGTFLRAYAAGILRTAFNPGAAILLDLANMPIEDDAFARERDQGPLPAALALAGRQPLQAAVAVTLAIVLMALYIFAACGVLRGAAPRSCLCLLLGASLYLLAVSGGAAGIARLRLPIMPAVCVLAAAGLPRNRSAP